VYAGAEAGGEPLEEHELTGKLERSLGIKLQTAPVEDEEMGGEEEGGPSASARH